jgi:hypothetical protein
MPEHRPPDARTSKPFLAPSPACQVLRLPFRSMRLDDAPAAAPPGHRTALEQFAVGRVLSPFPLPLSPGIWFAALAFYFLFFFFPLFFFLLARRGVLYCIRLAK